MSDTRQETSRKILTRLGETFPGIGFSTTLEKEEYNGRHYADTMVIHWQDGPLWFDVVHEAIGAICPMDTARPRLCIDTARMEAEA
jgi:hypothetical protein